MLFKAEDSKNEIFATISHELHRGALDHKHPFRFVVLSSSAKNTVESRYVVLRKVGQDLSFYFFTDMRSAKIEQLKNQPNVSLLFYHPQKRTQIRVNGQAVLHHQNEIALLHWKDVQGEAQKAYNSTLPPGTEVSDPQEGFHWKDDLSDPINFGVIEIQPDQIEALQLNGMEHLRITFDQNNGEWEGNWLVP